MKEPRVLFLDIENTPSLAWVWAMWKTDVIAVEEEWYILSFAYKWMGDKSITVKALPDYPGYKRDKQNDRALIKDVWKLLDEADIVIGHNVDEFDIKKINARCIYHRFKPYSPIKTVDTWKVFKKISRFSSNKLDTLCQVLGIGKKRPTTGFALWKGCMAGDEASWQKMKDYNVHDIYLLEKVYHLAKAWDKNHPNLALYLDREVCPTCKSKHTQKRGFIYYTRQKRQQWTCMDCGHWYPGKIVKANEK